MRRIVVETTRTTVRLVLAEGRGAGVRIRAVRIQPIGATGEASEALRGLSKGLKPAGAHVVGVISREQVITRVVKFPAMEYGELTQMVELYAKGQLPYPREQLVMDFHVLSQQGGFSTVAIVACQHDTVERQLAALRESGIAPTLLTVSSWGVLGWYRQAVRPDPSREPCLVVNVDDTRTDLVLVAGGRILSSRSVGQGSQDWEGVGEVAELLAAEVERSRAAIRKEVSGAEVRSLILTGVGPLSEWTGALSQQLALPVSVVDVREAFKGWTGPMTIPASAVVAGGLACSDLSEALNLSPPELRTHLHHRRQVRELTTVCLLLIGVLALGVHLLSLRVSRERQLAVRLARAITRLEPQAEQVQDQARATQLVSSVLENRRRLAVHLAELFGATPSAVLLEALTFEQAKQQITVRGSTTSTQLVLDYIKQLERIAGVERVDLRYTTQRSTPSGDRTDFELIVTQHRARATGAAQASRG
jgi:Tfp pilus assembly PilM family ATPase/Tfp pilus assembly protein PilN